MAHSPARASVVVSGTLLTMLQPRWRLVVTLLALIAAAIVVVLQVRSAFGSSSAAASDFGPLRRAADALRGGHSVYAHTGFVYPPTAAPLFLPLLAGSLSGAFHAWLYVGAAAVLAAVVIAFLPLRAQWWWLLAAAIAGCLLVKSDAMSDSLGLGNVSLMLAPVAVVVLLLFERESWTAGCGVLFASLLVKPLLAPLLLIPVLRRQWRPLVMTAAPAAAVLGLAALFVPGAGTFGDMVSRLTPAGPLVDKLRGATHGGPLVDKLAVYNLSLRGLGDRLNAPGVFLVPRILVVAIAVLGLTTWLRRPRAPGSTAAAAAMVLLAVMLAGTLSESHYLALVALCVMVALAARGELSACLIAAPGFVLLFLPRYRLGADWELATLQMQVRYVLAELLLFLAASWLVVQPRASRRELQTSLVIGRTASPRPSG